MRVPARPGLPPPGPALVAIALAALAACAPPGGPTAPGVPAPGLGGAPATPRPVPAASVNVSAADLTATWVFGNGGEPGPGPVATCDPAQIMPLLQEGERILGSVSRCAGPCSELEKLEGKNVAGKVTLSGVFKGNMDPVEYAIAYELTYDPATRHLRGTREGRPFWAAPWGDPGPTVCGLRISPSP